MSRYIIRVTSDRGIEVSGYLHFDWIRGKKYPEWWAIRVEDNGTMDAHSMTERQKDFFIETLTNNNNEFEVVRLV